MPERMEVLTPFGNANADPVFSKPAADVPAVPVSPLFQFRKQLLTLLCFGLVYVFEKTEVYQFFMNRHQSGAEQVL